MKDVAAILTALGLAALLAAHVLTALAAVWWARRRRAEAAAEPQPAVSILIPLKGTDAEIGENLAAFARQDYPEFEIVLAVTDPADPAMAEAKRAVAAFPGRMHIAAGPNLMQSSNPKTNTLARAHADARYPLVMHCDGNVQLAPDDLRRAVSLLAPTVGLVTAIYVGVRPRGFAGEIECAFFNGYHMRFLAAAAVLGHPAVLGKLMLYRRADLERAGGYARLGENPAHDTAMLRAIRGLGLRVRALPAFIRHPIGRRTWAEIWERQVRWFMVRRHNQPLVYAGEFVAGPIAAGVCAAAAAAFQGMPIGWWIAGTVGLWYAVEAFLLAAARLPMTILSPAAWIARDAMIPAMWGAALVSRSARWRGAVVAIGGGEAAEASRAAVKPRGSTIR